LKLNHLGARKVPRPLQANEQTLDIVKFDGIARQSGDMVRQQIIRRLGIDDMVLSREEENVLGGLGLHATRLEIADANIAFPG
jgi:hypothetical protein